MRLTLRRRRPARRGRGAPGAPERREDYRAVEVVPGAEACAAASRLEGRRVLTRFIHLFPLPLPECDAERCHCRYRHYPERRADDRRLPFAPKARNERRSGQDRRAQRRLRRARDQG